MIGLAVICMLFAIPSSFLCHCYNKEYSGGPAVFWAVATLILLFTAGIIGIRELLI